MNKRKISIAVVLIAAAIAFLLLKNCNSKGPDIIAAKDSVQYRWTKDSVRMITYIKQREQDFNKISKILRDSIKALQSGKFKNVNTAATIALTGNVRIQGSVDTSKILALLNEKIDSLQNSIEDDCPSSCPVIVGRVFENQWYTVKAAISIKWPTESFVEIQTKDSLTFLDEYVKEGGLFNRKSYLQVSVTNHNPYNKITGLEVYRKPIPKQKKFGIGLQAGSTLTSDLKPRPYFGIGVSYNIIRF